jgi:ParB family chromosome partitioning protein
MEFEHRSVPLDQIDDADTTYRISSGSSLHAITASIRQIGLINPPILLPGGQRHTIVSGFARIAACRQLGWPQIDARCLPAQVPYLKRALLAIADNAGQRELNIVELARSVGLIAGEAADHDQQTILLQSLGLQVNRDLVQKLNQILQMSSRLQHGLAEGTIALPVALRLHAMRDGGAAEELAKLFQELRLGLNRQRELLDWIQGIEMREDRSAAEILNQDPIAAWRQDATKDRGHVSQLIRQYLRNRRYPEISAFERHYAHHLQKLKLPGNLRIEAPPHFEGRTFNLRFDFQDKQDLFELSRELQRVIGSPALSELLSSTGSGKA